jgi:hypothetical protein
MMQLPASVDAHLRVRLIDDVRPLVFIRDAQESDQGFRLLAGDPLHYGHSPSGVARLSAFIEDLRAGRESPCTSYWPLVELPGGHPVNIHWFHEHECEYVIFTDADVCNAELGQRQQAANELALSNHALTKTIARLQHRRDELEAQTLSLAESQRLQRWLVDTLAHDVRTPLTAILGYAEVLRPAFDASETASRALDALKRSARVLTELAENLLATAQQRNAASEEQPWLLAELGADIESIIRPQAEQKGLAVLVETDDQERQLVTLDRVRLQRILGNLVSNAVRYTDSGSIRVGITLAASELLLEVQDTGAGIERAYHESIFEPLNPGAQRGRLGAGLGLSIVRALINDLGGALTLESEPGRGTLIKATIPREPTVTTMTARATTERSGVSANRRVVVIDDDPTVTELLAMIIESTGLEAHTTNAPADAIELTRRVDPGVILIDHRMGAWDGVSLIAQLRQGGFNGTVVMVSGDTGDDLQRSAREAGADLCLRKPLNVAALKQFLRRP